MTVEMAGAVDTKAPAKRDRIENIVFEFTCEQGSQRMTLKEYMRNPDYTDIFGRQSVPPKGRQTLFMGKQILSFPTELVKKEPRMTRLFDDAERMYKANPLKYFVPQSQMAVDFLNWRVDTSAATMKVLHAGTGCGKSVLGCVDVLLQIVPTEPDWPIFKDFGVHRREYRGPLVNGGVAVVSYELKNHEETLWPQVIRRWTPLQYIEDYISGKKTISWRAGPKLTIADTPVLFKVSSQKDTTFVSVALDTIWWDEQSTEEKFNNANDRVIRRGGRHVCTMTPHHIDGRNDTGAGSYIDRIRKGELDVGLDVKFFQMSMDDVADWVVRADDKRRKKLAWIEDPIRTGNKKKLAEGRSIVYGEFHESSGLVLDDWDNRVHLIEPFEIPKNWTIYRYHDHGRKEPNAAILVAVNEQNDYFIIDEHYGRDKEISENAREIIEIMTGNTIEKNSFGTTVEIKSKYDVMRTVSDPRSLTKALDSARHTIQDEYMSNGLVLVHGCGQRPELLVPLVGELLRVDINRKHFVTKEMGAPRIYVFNNCQNFVREITGWRVKKTRVVGDGGIRNVEKPMQKDDHLMTCLMLLAADHPQYVPKKRIDKDIWIVDYEQEDKDETRCPLTGW